jgi:hypothetical protein
MAPALSWGHLHLESGMFDEQAVLERTGDEAQVNLEHDWQRRNWAKWLGCSEEELKLAVETMGPDLDNVRRFLRQLH